MSRPTAISPEEQEQIARKIGVLLLQGAPEDWQEITVEYRATGEYTDLLGEMSAQDGESRRLEPPAELREIFERLREGMYRPDVGTWLSALYVVERPSSYRIDINFDTEPQWRRPLPRAAYVDELRRYPRAEENIPDWMRERVEGVEPSGTSAEVPDSPAGVATEPTANGSADEQAEFRFANVFDGVDDEGRPVVAERQPVPGDEVSALRQYLESAPVVLSARENEEDLLASDRDRSVPSSWHTDGTWVWASAVAYYLAQYGLPPETALVDHVRSRGFRVSGVDDATRDAVVRELTEQPAEEPVIESAEEPVEQADPAAEEAELDEKLEEVPATTGSRHVLEDGDDAPDTQEVLAELHDRLTGYQVDSAEYRIGSTTEDARCLVQDGDDWAVVGGGEDVRFARVDHAASFLLGRLLLDLPVPAASATPAAPAAPAATPAASAAPDVPAAPAPSAPSAASAAGPEIAEPAMEVPDPTVDAEVAEPVTTQDEPAGRDELTGRDELAPQGAPESELPQRGAPQEPAADLPQRSEPASDLPKRTPQESMPKPSSSGPSTGGNPLFTANQDPGPAVPEPPAAEAPQQQPMDRPLPPQAPPSPPVGQPAQPPNGATPGAAGPLPKRQPRRDTGAPVPPPGAPGAQGGPAQGGPAQGGQPQGGQAQVGQAGARPAPNGPGASGANRPSPPPAPPRPPQGGQQQGQPQAGQQGQPQAGQPQAGQQGQQPGPQGQQQAQQIQPLNGEPPLTLYRDRRIVMLQPGTELDRFGEPSGNVLYTARTPYTHRSLPPQWSNRGYSAYRVQRPIQALRGTAVPWFEQPGGGTAFVLPGAVSDLLADGTLAEMPANERPPME